MSSAMVFIILFKIEADALFFPMLDCEALTMARYRWLPPFSAGSMLNCGMILQIKLITEICSGVCAPVCD
jgi:hypothetical protein